MSKRWTSTILAAAILAVTAGGAYAADAEPAGQPEKKTPPKPYQICLWPKKCGPSVGKGKGTKPAVIKPIQIQIDPLSLKIMEMKDVPTAMRINGKTVYVNGDGSLALPKAAIPQKKRSATSTPDEAAFKTVDMKTRTAAQANEMSERSSKIKGGSKADAEKVFGTGEKSKS